MTPCEGIWSGNNQKYKERKFQTGNEQSSLQLHIVCSKQSNFSCWIVFDRKAKESSHYEAAWTETRFTLNRPCFMPFKVPCQYCDITENFMRKCCPLKWNGIHYPKKYNLWKTEWFRICERTEGTELCTFVSRAKFVNLILKCLSAESWSLKDKYITRQFTSTQTKLNLNRLYHNITRLFAKSR